MRPNYFDFGKYQSRRECNLCREVVETLRTVIAELRLWRARVRERRELAALDHVMMRDIGVTPAEITRECNKPFWRG